MQAAYNRGDYGAANTLKDELARKKEELGRYNDVVDSRNKAKESKNGK